MTYIKQVTVTITSGNTNLLYCNIVDMVNYQITPVPGMTKAGVPIGTTVCQISGSIAITLEGPSSP